MGLLDALLGRTKPVLPKLDNLFGLPSAAITLQAATDYLPTGVGSVCFRAAEGKAFSDIEQDVTDLLNASENTIIVRAEDQPEDRYMPRGKQYWEPKSKRIWYTRTTGIWQPVWLEATAYDLVTAADAGRTWLKAHPVTHLVHFKDPKHEFQFYEVR